MESFFYYGIAMYKQGSYVLAIAAFEKSERIYEDDAQLHYNLGLAYFKIGNYQHTVEHFKKCIINSQLKSMGEMLPNKKRVVVQMVSTLFCLTQWLFLAYS